MTSDWLHELRRVLAPSETKTLASLSVVVGVTAGVAAFIFINLVRVVEWWTRSAHPGAVALSNRFYAVLPPVWPTSSTRPSPR